jgi:uncharacterized protein
MRMLRRAWIAVAWLPVIFVAGGCSSYSRQAPAIRDALMRDDYETAIKEVEKIDRSGSELLYCYELGLVLHEQGDYAASNAVFERADQVLQELYTKSISRELGAITINETLVKYRGDAFEAVLVNYYKILNYLFLEEIEDALVECRRLNQKIQLLHDAGETYFADDPFLQYLTGLVYELGGEPTSAEVSYRASLQGYESDSTLAAPPWLPCDASQNAMKVGDAVLASSYSKDFPCPEASGTRGRVAVLIETGAVARKIETSFTVPLFENDRYSNQDKYAEELYTRRGKHYEKAPHIKYWLHVALPVMQVDPPVQHRAVVRVSRPSERNEEDAEVTAVRVEDLDLQAQRAFEEKETTIVMRAIARALAKYLASSAASSKDEGLGTLINLLGVITETADTRSWTTLPGAVSLARLDLEPGTYRIDVDVVDARGLLLVHRSFDDVEVQPDGLEVRRVRLR